MRRFVRRHAPSRRHGGPRRFAPTAAALAAVFLAGCGGEPELEARTFELQYLNPGEAVEMVRPYVYTDRPASPGVVSSFSGGITVRETADNLDKIARVLEEYDRAKPGVRLWFQIIAADGPAEPDERIRGVESALRDLFRFEGYRLVAETQMAAMEGTGSTQTLLEDGQQFLIEAHVQEVRGSTGGGSVVISVALISEAMMGRAIQTSMAVPVGQTVVLGSAKPFEGPTLILTVRPEFVTLSDSAG